MQGEGTRYQPLLGLDYLVLHSSDVEDLQWFLVRLHVLSGS